MQGLSFSKVDVLHNKASQVKAHLKFTSTPRFASIFNGFAFTCFEHALGAPVLQCGMQAYFCWNIKTESAPHGRKHQALESTRKKIKGNPGIVKISVNGLETQGELNHAKFAAWIIAYCMFGKKTIMISRFWQSSVVWNWLKSVFTRHLKII